MSYERFSRYFEQFDQEAQERALERVERFASDLAEQVRLSIYGRYRRVTRQDVDRAWQQLRYGSVTYTPLIAKLCGIGGGALLGLVVQEIRTNTLAGRRPFTDSDLIALTLLAIALSGISLIEYRRRRNDLY